MKAVMQFVSFTFFCAFFFFESVNPGKKNWDKYDKFKVSLH